MGGTDDARGLTSSAYRARFIAVLFLVATFNLADRSVFAATAQTIKADLRLDDGQLGLLQGLVFASLYSVLGLPVGWLAERVNRARIIAVSIGVWLSPSRRRDSGATIAGRALRARNRRTLQHARRVRSLGNA